MENQISIFDMMYPKYKITKPIRLIEFFAGYGSQALALKYLGADFEHWKICEWAVKSIQAYKDIHFSNINIDFGEGYSKNAFCDWLYEKGISANYNEPMTKQQIQRLSIEQLKTIFNNIMTTDNLVNIQQVKGKDLDIVDTDKYDYILTYSFPCQDLSLAGKGKGMSDTSTRSGMLWEVERILNECKELGSLPQILLMENVPQVHSVDNVGDFNKWQQKLEELGYKNYFKDLIATDYGIPQTRNRTFMISLLGDYSYSFPVSVPLKLKLKDMLEDNVSEKYYLSDKMINYVLNRTPIGEKDNYARNIIGNGSNKNAGTLTTSGSNTGTSCRSGDNFIVDNLSQNEIDEQIYLKKDTENYIEWEDGKNIQMNCRAWKDDKVVATLNTGGEAKILIKNNTKKGYLEATNGDGIDISGRMEHHRGTVQKNKAQSLTTQCERGVVVDTLKRDLCNKLIEDGLVEEGDVVKHSYTSQILEGNKKCVEKNDGNMITLTTRGDCVGVCVGTYQYANSDNFMNGRSRFNVGKEAIGTILTEPKEGIITVNNKNAKHQQDFIQDSEGNARTLVSGTHGNGGHYTKTLLSDLRIRKLTPRECFRLMGVKDEDFEKVKKNQSDSSLYHLAGDSIVVNVLMAIFKELF